MFKWAAPLFARFGDRWSEDDAGVIADRLRPYVPVGGHLLDLGGGTGALAVRMAAAIPCRVTVLDHTPEMLSHVPRENPAVAGVLGSAESMPFAGSTFDAVIVSDAFHHFGDQDRAVREMARVVRCGGGALVLDLDPRGLMRLIVLAERLLGEPGTFFTPEGMCDFFAERGITGHCEKTRGASYYFLGTVGSPAPSPTQETTAAAP